MFEISNEEGHSLGKELCNYINEFRKNFYLNEIIKFVNITFEQLQKWYNSTS